MTYSTTMHLTGRNTGVPVPEEMLDQLGGGKRPAVNVTVNGYAYRSTVARMGERFLIAFSSDKRAETGIEGNDPIEVTLSLDTEPRVTPVPDDLAAALAGHGLTEAFTKLAPSHQKAHVTSVEGAKAADTRLRRIDAVVAKLQA
ncbi:DUF1905 domain-containing protein [Naasia lichenicola]|uniref:DUF1905 domain-containing protein n=1 Tax=Naasia lichenicola TaxID=2565933 RepID=A0A4S4FSA6_9MICO|nr:DUF1905 domain-containing protein [Naasia lichenicola]